MDDVTKKSTDLGGFIVEIIYGRKEVSVQMHFLDQEKRRIRFFKRNQKALVCKDQNNDCGR